MKYTLLVKLRLSFSYHYDDTPYYLIEKEIVICSYFEYDCTKKGYDSMKLVNPILKSLFSSKVRVKVLEHFFFHPGEEFYIRHLSSALPEPVGTVARELTHLEKAGILSSRRIGKQRHYSLRKDCPIIDDLRNIFLKTSGAGAELRAILEKLSGVEIAFIYGSYASGEANASSDLDLMIVGDISDRDLAPLVARVERKLKREISYTVYSRAEAKKRIGEKGDFVGEVFSSPRTILIGGEDDELFRTA